VSIRHFTHLPALVLIAVALSGCAELGPSLGGKEKARAHPRADDVRPRAERAQRTDRVSRPAAGTTDRSDVALGEGIALYNDGDYNGAIRRLNGGDMAGATPRERLSAAKYTAFSYCVSGRQALCRETFDRAFRLDPGFDLAAGEHGHPLWGPAFSAAKAAARR
jgi:Flp pilus assembly protein TadD